MLCSPVQGGGDRIRTCGTFRYTRFPSERIRPLCHSSAIYRKNLCTISLQELYTFSVFASRISQKLSKVLRLGPKSQAHTMRTLPNTKLVHSFTPPKVPYTTATSCFETALYVHTAFRPDSFAL
jgi:hypothetical protein